MTARAEQLDDSPVVLVVDDSPDVHRLLAARLQTEAFELISAKDGLEGLDLARSESPTIILLDLDMPGMDGFEVLRTLKDDSTISDIPVLVISGMHSPHDKVTAFDLGAVDFIAKPFDLTELRIRVRSALRMRQLVLMLAQKAQIDGLTGLWNRAHFDARWATEASRVQRYGGALTLALLDLDHFKSINDSYGHPAGDAVLQTFAKLTQQEARQSDICCRYGGEEFAVILPETSPGKAQALFERIRERLESMTWARHPTRAVTVSVGVVGVDGRSKLKPDQWIERADQKLYEAKAGGRNRVLVADVTDPPPRLADAG